MLGEEMASSDALRSEQATIDKLLHLYAQAYATKKIAEILLHMATVCVTDEKDMPVQELTNLIQAEDKVMTYIKDNVFTIKDN